MNLNDFINQEKNPPKKVEPEAKISHYELNTFDNISKEKKNLILEMYNYFPKKYYRDIITEYYPPHTEYGYVRTKINGQEGLIELKIANLRGSYDERAEAIPETEFYQKYNKYTKYNSQKYTSCSLKINKSTVDEYIVLFYPIYFFEDGKVFMDPDTAKVIADHSFEYLGKELSQTCIQIERQEEYLKNKKLVLKNNR